MKTFALLIGACLCVALWVAGTPARADEMATAGREVATKWQQAVITLEVVSKTRMNMFGQESTEENKTEARGVVIDGSGLIVTALSSLDPISLIADLMGGMGLGDEEEKMKPTTEITGVKIILADGKTIAAQVVMRDKDLDLAFVRPLKKVEQPLTALAIDAAGEPALLDNVFLMSRLGTEGSRAVSMTIDRVKSVIEKPRRLYVLNDADDTGMPVFTTDGKFVGLVTLRLPPKGAGGIKSFSMAGPGMIMVAVPAADIAECAKQAPQAEVKPAPAPEPAK